MSITKTYYKDYNIPILTKEQKKEKKKKDIMSQICRDCGRYKKISAKICNDCWKDMEQTIKY